MPPPDKGKDARRLPAESSAEKSDNSTFILTLTPTPDPLNRPAIARVRSALKVLLRGFALRCIRIEQKSGVGP